MKKGIIISIVVVSLFLFVGAFLYMQQTKDIVPTASDQINLEPTSMELKTDDISPVPPAPNKEENDATLAGIDVNTNGIRDDVERFLLETYGLNEAVKSFTLKSAQLLQAALIEPRPTEERTEWLMQQGVKNPYIGKAAQEYLTSIECMDSRELEQSDIITKKTLTTPLRKSAYAILFAGSILEECTSNEK